MCRGHSHGLISSYSLHTWDKGANTPKCDGKKGRRLEKQIYEHVIIMIEHVVHGTMQHKNTHRYLQFVNPVKPNVCVTNENEMNFSQC